MARNASQNSAKEAQDAEGEVTKLHDKTANLTTRAEAFRKEAKHFADRAFVSERAAKALENGAKDLYAEVKNIFCKTKPTDQVCTARRKKRETKNLNNQPMTNGASRPTSFISQIFYHFAGQDKYKIEQELDQKAKMVNAADIAAKFEDALRKTASKCGIPEESLNFDPRELMSTIRSRSLLNDENRNELLKLLYLSAKGAVPNYKQTDKFLATFKVGMERTLASNEQQRGFVDTATDNEQPNSFMSDVTPPSAINAVGHSEQKAIGVNLGK